MNSQPKVLRVLGVVALIASISGCDLLTPKVDASKAEDLVRSIFTREGIEVESVTCPPDQPMKANHSFECTAVAKGTEVHFTLVVTNVDTGEVTATPRDHTLPVKSIEPEIANDLRAQGHTVKEIDCHGDVWVAIPGAVVTCDVIDETGAAYLWSAEFTDDEGGHTHKIEPKA